MAHVEWLTEPEARAWRGLQLMQAALDHAMARQLADDAALSYAEYRVLVVLTDQPDGRLRLYEFGELLSWEKSRVSHQITRMARRGLVRKESCDSDRRGAYVVVTDRGRAEIEAAAPGHVATVRRIFIDRLSPQQLDALSEITETILAGLGNGGRASATTGSAG